MPETILHDETVIVLTIVASVDGLHGYTVVVISLIDSREDDFPESIIWFEESVYRFDANPDRLGAIGTVKAVSKFEENVLYSATDESGKNLELYCV